jgi:molybdopterin synthase sulfur carrier subunit
MPNVQEQTWPVAKGAERRKGVMKIGFFGSLREAIGDECEIDAERGETVAQLRLRLAALHPRAAPELLGPRVRACVGDTIVGDDFALRGNERVEFLPPLSGG